MAPGKRSKKKTKVSHQKMPEYQPIPRGLWHMLGAVMLMIPTFSLVVSFLSGFLEAWFEIKAIIYFDVSALVFFTLTLSIPTMLIVFGYAWAQRFLLAQNLVLASVLSVAVLYSVVFDTYLKATLWGLGLSCALLARKLYTSEGFANYRDYAKAAWSAHRANRKY
ncbi:hypothetical protein [Marinobacter xestospongiae]|uniref:hypothetical protein n=1 Tax=Marinobacter xestospongiae TaxID=994319 RepID=UPI002004FCEB|nr:hypothetical protein [Marinobacter xestospongiae]MCK7569179.1 hypothetical protein [Marinobacter xestospongiae]